MKTVARKCLAAAAIVAISKSDASTSSVRGGGNSNSNSRSDSAGSNHDGGDAFNGFLSRRSLNHVNIRRHDETSQANQRQIQEEPSSYWWLNKESNEKDIAYKSNEDESISTYSNSLFKTHYEKEKEDGLNSFSVYTIAVDKNPDTSGLPYRSPSKKPTERPTALPTEDITTDAPTPHQKVEQYTKQVVDAEKMYFYPIWADTFKGCASSAVPPDAYLASPSEYIFTALSECCQFWFDSAAECLSSRDRSKEDYSVNMDEYMFQMNGAEAYSDGDATSEDVNTSLDVPTPPPLPGANTMPPAMASLFPTPAGDVTFPPVGVTSPTPTYMPTLGDGVEVPGGGVSPPPSPATSINYTPYPTFGAIIEPTPPPVFEGTVSTPSPSQIGGATSPPYGTGAVLTPLPSYAGSIMATAPPVGGNVVPFTPQPTPFGSSTTSSGGTSPPPMMSVEATPWPTFSDLTSNPDVPGGAFTPQPTNAGTANSTTASSIPGTISSTTAGSIAGTVSSTTEGSIAGTVSSTTEGSIAGTVSTTTAGSIAGTVSSTTVGSIAGTAISSTAVSSAGTASATTAGTFIPTSASSIASSSASSSPGTNSSSFISDQNITKLSPLAFRDPLTSTPNSVIYSDSFETGSIDLSKSDQYFSWSMDKSSDNVSAWEVISSSDVNSFNGSNFIAQTGLFTGEESAVSSLTLTVGMVDSNYDSNIIEVLKNGAYVTFAIDLDVAFPIDSFMFRVDDKVVRSWDAPTDGWQLVSAYLPPMEIGEQHSLSWSYGYFGATSSVKSGACKLDAVVVEALSGDLDMFDEQSEEDVSHVLNLHVDDSDFGWKLTEVGEGAAYEGAFAFTTSTRQIENGFNAKRLFMSHAKSDLMVLSGDAKMSVTVITGASGGTLEFAVMSGVSFPLDVLEIGVDGSPFASITEVSNDWEVHRLELIPGKHTVYFRHIANPTNLPQSELEETTQPDGYKGASLVDGIRYSDNNPTHPSLFPTIRTTSPTII